MCARMEEECVCRLPVTEVQRVCVLVEMYQKGSGVGLVYKKKACFVLATAW